MASNLLKAMIDALEDTEAGFISVSNGKYTVMLTDDSEGAEHLKAAWDEYADSAETEKNREDMCGAYALSVAAGGTDVTGAGKQN